MGEFRRRHPRVQSSASRPHSHQVARRRLRAGDFEGSTRGGGKVHGTGNRAFGRVGASALECRTVAGGLALRNAVQQGKAYQRVPGPVERASRFDSEVRSRIRDEHPSPAQARRTAHEGGEETVIWCGMKPGDASTIQIPLHIPARCCSIPRMSYQPKPIDTEGATLPQELLPLTERLAENAHDLWAAQRLAQGWSFGPQRDDKAKKHPCLVPYNELPESEKEYDL